MRQPRGYLAPKAWLAAAARHVYDTAVSLLRAFCFFSVSFFPSQSPDSEVNDLAFEMLQLLFKFQVRRTLLPPYPLHTQVRTSSTSTPTSQGRFVFYMFPPERPSPFAFALGAAGAPTQHKLHARTSWGGTIHTRSMQRSPCGGEQPAFRFCCCLACDCPAFCFVFGQERARLADPAKSKTRRRIVMGLREVLRGVKAKKVQYIAFVVAWRGIWFSASATLFTTRGNLFCLHFRFFLLVRERCATVHT